MSGDLAQQLRVRIETDRIEREERFLESFMPPGVTEISPDAQRLAQRTLHWQAIQLAAAVAHFKVDFWAAFPLRRLGYAWLQRLSVGFGDNRKDGDGGR